jgi:hypothetical protein
MIDRWCTSERGEPKLTLPGAQSHIEQLAHHGRYARDARQWLDHFLDRCFLVAKPGAADSPALSA